ncbi:hypothetical protein POTOM_053611 [Populus tomentosa]|uniref:Uncharacterized protein n=1 Tax=Populus tomentosa TaxID=118781 RepID=A0A8X8C7Q7_POPTO|nr:hypothetical protein POTOM_053611 [Populus tomentosa]
MQDRGVHKDPGWSYVVVEGAKATHLRLEQIVAGAMLSKVSGDHTRKDAKATHLELEQIVAGEVIIYTRKVSGEDYSWNGISFLESILKDAVQSIW